MIMFYHSIYLYFSSVSFFEEMVSLVPVNMCRIRNRTIVLIIKKKLAVPGVGPINIFGSNERVKEHCFQKLGASSSHPLHFYLHKVTIYTGVVSRSLT